MVARVCRTSSRFHFQQFGQPLQIHLLGKTKETLILVWLSHSDRLAEHHYRDVRSIHPVTNEPNSFPGSPQFHLLNVYLGVAEYIW